MRVRTIKVIDEAGLTIRELGPYDSLLLHTSHDVLPGTTGDDRVRCPSFCLSSLQTFFSRTGIDYSDLRIEADIDEVFASDIEGF